MHPAMRALIPFLIFTCLGASAADAPAPRSVFLEELTWTEVRAATTAGKTTIIVPIGGTEQSGPHIALGKHNARVRFLAGQIASRLGDALVAPVLAYVPEGGTNPPTAHMRFPGTITIPENTFEEILVSAGRGFRLHGFKDIVFIGDHGGYQKGMQKAADALNREWASTPVRAHAIPQYYHAADVEFAKALRDKGFTPAEVGAHAGVADTSLALAVDPALVRSERLASRMGKADGVEGDPKRSSAELGKIGVELIVERTTEAIKQAVARR